jgi:hypothetical protein
MRVRRFAWVLVGAWAACDNAGLGPDDLAVADLAASTDAQPDADNGAPSTMYPAPHPPLPQLINRTGGPVLTSPTVRYVFYPGDAREMDLQIFAQKVAASSYWATTTSEYGVGALKVGAIVELTGETAPKTISSTDIQTWIGNEIKSGKLGAPDPQAIYTVVYPASTTVTQPNPVSTLLPPSQSCSAFTGYHDDVSVNDADAGAPVSYAYAVIPTCGALDSITSTLSHEWVEAATDPLVTSTGAFNFTGGSSAAFYLPDQDHLIWAVLGGGEAGDLCEPEGAAIDITPTEIGHAVQRTWSNVAARASHDPCVPKIAGAYFAAAPLLTETVTFTSSLTGSVTTQGITIPVGQSKTIEVDLFSDGDTGGPWTVSAADVLSSYYSSYGFAPSMKFAWDRTEGGNGEKLHLTITVTTASIVGSAHAFMITSTRGGRTAVWPGLVVER